MKIENDDTRIIHMSHFVDTLWKCKYYVVGVTIVFAIAFTVFGCMDLKQKAAKERSKPHYKEETIEVTTEQFYNVRTIVELEELLKQNVEYNENSVLQNMDPLHKWASVDLYTVISQNEFGETSVGIAHRYAEYLSGTENYQSMIEELGLKIEENYLRELLYFESNEQSQFSINICYEDSETLQKIRDYVLEQINQWYQNDLADGKCYTFEINASGIQEQVDSDLSARQNAIRTTIMDAQESLKYKRSLLTEGEREYLELYYIHGDEVDYEEGQPLTKVSEVKKKDYSISLGNLKTYIKKGVLAGLFFAMMLFSILYIFSNRLLNPQNLREMYGLCVLSVLPKGKKRMVELKTMAVKLFLINDKKEKGSSKIGLISSCVDQMKQDEWNQIVESMEEQGLCVKVIGDVINNSENMKQLSEVDSLVLLEKIIYSRLANIQKETELLQDTQKEIDGVIILG